MATYKVDFYNTTSGWFHSSVEVDAVTPGLAEAEARDDLGPDNSYYRTSVTVITPDPVEEVPAESGEEVSVNG